MTPGREDTRGSGQGVWNTTGAKVQGLLRPPGAPTHWQSPQGGPPGRAAQAVAGGWLPQADLLAPGSLSEALSVLLQTQGACFPVSRNTAFLLAPGPAPQAGRGLLHTDLHLYPPRPSLLA